MAEQQPMPPTPGGEIACGRAPLIDAIATFLAREHAPDMGAIRESLGRVIDEAGPDALTFLGKRLAGAGSDWSYYPSDPLARHIHHVLADRVLEQEPVLLGTEYLADVADHPLVIFANHLSYSDANALEVLLQRAGATRLADRLTVVAGPKVYSNLRRRFSSLCFGTIKVPQNSARATDEAVMSAREAGHAARRAIQVAKERLRLGEALLVFAEGTRSRSGEMQELLPGVARYLDSPGTLVLPVGIVGTERLFPIGQDSLSPVRIVIRIGRPIPAGALIAGARGNRRLIMDCVGAAIAALLPPEYRGAYAGHAPHLHAARRLLRHVRR
jgi:1-acyl-sn-glycerol-3-phosphate acyltransferase